MGSMVTMYSSLVSAGFPHTVTSDIEDILDVNSLVIKNPASTYFVRVDGDSMIDADIRSGGILVEDRSLEVINGRIIIAFLNGKACVKRLYKKDSQISLIPENPNYKIINITAEDDFEIWGSVSFVIHKT